MEIMTSQQKMSRTTITETPGEHTHTAALLPQPVTLHFKCVNKAYTKQLKLLPCPVWSKEKAEVIQNYANNTACTHTHAHPQCYHLYFRSYVAHAALIGVNNVQL
jgi:hypothetical protein